MKPIRIAKVALIARTLLLAAVAVEAADGVARAQGPYGQLGNAPISFAVATAGESFGNGVSVFQADNRVFNPSRSTNELNAGPQASASTPVYIVTEGNAGQARASATFGSIKLWSAMTDNADTGLNLHAGALADAGWIDRVTISHPFLNGQQGTLTLLLDVSGALFGRLPRGGAVVQLGVIAGGATDSKTFSAGADRFLGDASLGIREPVPLTVPVVFGQQFTMTVRGIAVTGIAARPPGGAGSAALADLENSIYWSGIQGISQGGAPVTGFTITAASGADYTRSFVPISAAPEPGTLALLAGVFSVAAAVGGRRRKAVRLGASALAASSVMAGQAPAARAQIVNAYGQAGNAPVAFAMATAGESFGNGIGLFTGDNRVLNPARSENQLDTGLDASAVTSVFIVTEGNAAKARAEAGMGYIKVYGASTDYAATGQSLKASAIMDAGWLDRVTISHPFLVGQQGTFSFGLDVSGYLFGGKPSGAAVFQLTAMNSLGANTPHVYQAGGTPLESGELGIRTTAVFTLPVVFGTPFTLQVRGLGVTGLNSSLWGAGSAAELDLGSSVYWDGIRGVFQGNTPVTGFTVASASGTDYTRSLVPVTAAPEPGTFALLGVVLGVVAIVVKRPRTA